MLKWEEVGRGKLTVSYRSKEHPDVTIYAVKGGYLVRNKWRSRDAKTWAEAESIAREYQDEAETQKSSVA